MTTERAAVPAEGLVRPTFRLILCGHRFLPMLALGIAFSGSVVGCGDPDLPHGFTRKTIAFDEVPDTLRIAARKAIPKVDFKEAWQNLDSQGKLDSYEIRG